MVITAERHEDDMAGLVDGGINVVEVRQIRGFVVKGAASEPSEDDDESQLGGADRG